MNKIFKVIFSNKVIIHIICWIAYICYFIFYTFARFADAEIIFLDFCLNFSAIISLFYGLSHYSFKFLFEKKIIIKGIIFLLVFIGLFYALNHLRYWLAFYDNALDDLPKYYTEPKRFFIYFFYEVLRITAFAAAYWFYNYSKKQQKQKLALEQRNHEIEVSFLKSQINQHFVYNMLNMFYSNAMKYSDTLAEGILSLSELMRFSVSHEQNSLIAVSEEIKYVESYIQLNQLRFEEKLLINFKTEGDLGAYKIPHLCILTLVENAFKHGNLKTKPLDISIIANTEELKVSLKNQKRTSRIEDSTGIGLENLERRLSLLLENRFSLETHQDQSFFYTELIIRPSDGRRASVTLTNL